MSTELNVLVIFAHPALHKSRLNKHLIKIYSEMASVEFRDLYELYPRFFIDVEVEQKYLLESDLIIFHHPFYWYSSPPILKHWLDLVLLDGFAYGQNGSSLAGKHLLSVLTTGGSRQSYSESGENRYEMGTLLRPFEQTAHLCKMNYLPPYVIHGANRILESEQVESEKRKLLETLQKIQKKSMDDTWPKSLDYNYLQDALT
ncbi:MAG: NAD(P)H-dependent oxidoreductase [Pseudobacteriovorax sp.]|nr:NAD(P)H-dependent oxidoreductase [Pseudobacteriovorax sp.]